MAPYRATSGYRCGKDLPADSLAVYKGLAYSSGAPLDLCGKPTTVYRQGLMAEITAADVSTALQSVIDPQSGQNIIAGGLVRGISVQNGHVRFAVEVPASRGAAAEPLRAAAENAVRPLAGVEKVTAVLTAHSETEVPQSPHGAREPRKTPAPAAIPGVKAVIAVASGKGGVGKSTVAANLALALSARGLKTGLLDADIYGPSVPTIFGLTTSPEQTDGHLLPLEKFGLKLMSIGTMVEPDMAMIWRGPMVQSAILQMLRQVAWGELDVLVIDLPPGTGDAQLGIVQNVTLAGAVIVSTPQDLALIDARRAVQMFHTTHVPVLGLVENMSGFVCPHCGQTTPIFGQGGAQNDAGKNGLAFLGAVPLTLSIRETSDSGSPIVASQPQSAEAKAFHLIGAQVAEKIF